MASQTISPALPRSRKASSGPSRLALSVALLVVAGLVLGPLLILLRTALTPPDTFPLDGWEFTFQNFGTILASSELPTLLLNTAVYAFGSIVIGLVMAAWLAWLVERTDMPGRTFIRIALFTWMAVPPVILGFGWILLINPGNGILNALWSFFTGEAGPLTIYSMWALIFITGVSVTPTAFVMIGGLFRNMDPQLETAGFERGLMLRSPARFQVAARRLVELYKAHEREVEPSVREAVLRSWMGTEAYALSIYSTASRLAAGGHIGAEASTNKIFWSEMDIALHKAALSILGARAELLRSAPEAGDIGRWLDGYFFSLAGPIYAGSNEIQRNIIAERMLGLPRA